MGAVILLVCCCNLLYAWDPIWPVLPGKPIEQFPGRPNHHADLRAHCRIRAAQNRSNQDLPRQVLDYPCSAHAFQSGSCMACADREHPAASSDTGSHSSRCVLYHDAWLVKDAPSPAHLQSSGFNLSALAPRRYGSGSGLPRTHMSPVMR
jgi:hypothetical protein